MKGQAALEFMFTYAWALVSVTVIVGAFIYFGMFRTHLPSKCIFTPEILCQEYVINGDVVHLRFRNAVGVSSDFTFSMYYPDLDRNATCTDPSLLQGIKHGKYAEVNCTFIQGTFSKDSAVRLAVQGTYKKSSGNFAMPFSGEIYGTVK
jgi:hypothetical protein